MAKCSNFVNSVADAQMQTKLGYWDIVYNVMSQTLTEGAPNLITTLGAGTPAIAHNLVAASEQALILLDDNDEVYGRATVPWWLDLARDISAQVCVEVGEASKANMDLTLHAKVQAVGEASTDAKVSADGSATFAALSNTLLGELVWTNIVALGMAGEIASLSDVIQFAVTLADKGTASADVIGLVCVRFWGTVQLSHSTKLRQQTST